MSDLLRTWLAEELGLPLSDNVERVHDRYALMRLVEKHETRQLFMHAQDFASGYLFGQLLNKYNLQPDVEHFDTKRMPDSMINNYTRLQVRSGCESFPRNVRTAAGYW